MNIHEGNERERRKNWSDEKKGVKNFMNLLLAIAAVYIIFI